MVHGQGRLPGPARGCDVAALPARAGWGLPALPQGVGGQLGPACGSPALHRLSAPEKQPCVPQHSHPVAPPPPAPGTMVCGGPLPFAAGGDGDGAFLPPLPAVCVVSVIGCLTPQPAPKGSCGCPVSPGCPPGPAAAEPVMTPQWWLPAPAPVVPPAGAISAAAPGRWWLGQWKLQGVKLLSCGKHLPHHPASLEPRGWQSEPWLACASPRPLASGHPEGVTAVPGSSSTCGDHHVWVQPSLSWLCRAEADGCVQGEGRHCPAAGLPGSSRTKRGLVANIQIYFL